ncbi:hypothetical protein OS493_002455 [Desmophyllum pertusum]|uniref:Mis18 domain-containing protein n=1 Tax=Desmophyllum pertusum TaxID=174260 RepID=A0A9W9YW89_9CNID|nr:hypothetical protein OS493_002455 [Desmophyllum pertusum]
MAANSREESNLTAVDQLKTEESLPVVFQCSACNGIFGDSCAWVSSDRELELICVNSVTSLVSLGECLETSTQGADIGSTFMPLQCKSCNSSIGRIYRTTPRELDHLRNLYCLDVEQIKSYQVGSMNGTHVNGMSSLSSEEVLDLPTAKTLQQGIHKIESVIIMMLERLTSLEAGLGNKTNQEDTNSDLSASQVPAKDISRDNDRKPNKKKRK